MFSYKIGKKQKNTTSVKINKNKGSTKDLVWGRRRGLNNNSKDIFSTRCIPNVKPNAYA